MAKKDPKELPVEEKLKALFQLQTTLSGIDEKRALRGELPLEVRDLEDELEGLHIRIEKIEQDIKDYQNAITQKKGNIVDAQASFGAFTTSSLDSVANNREYDTLTKESSSRHLRLSFVTRRLKRLRLRLKRSVRTWKPTVHCSRIVSTP